MQEISLRRQCELVGLNRSSYYFRPQALDEETMELLRLIDEEYTRHPFLGTRRMRVYLRNLGYPLNRKRIQSLYHHLGIEAIYPKPRLHLSPPGQEVYPYLLRGLEIDRCNQVWSSDITYLRMKEGFVYLVAIMDWFSRYVLSWVISPRLEADFCVEALKRVISMKSCDIFNTDQGVQYTAQSFTGLLKDNQIQISMDGRGRVFDNIFIERLWRSLKQECIYLREFAHVWDLETAVGEYFDYYNNHRPHQALGYQTPAQVYRPKNS